MKFQFALWIFMMGINFSINKDPKRHCYQAEKVHTRTENIPKIRGQRSLYIYGQALKTRKIGVCSTWGNFQYRTFDGEMYRFPGICNYLFASHCGKHYEDFNIQIDQSWDKSLPTISQLSVKLNELLIEVIDQKPSIHGKIIKLPYSNNGIQIDRIDNVLHVSAKFMLELTWEESNIIHLTLNKKYMGETCGLCGNYNGNATDDLIYSGNVIDPLLFGKMHKMRKPEQKCDDPKPVATKKCKVYRSMCLKHLRNYKWMKCNRLLNPEPFVEAYMLDMCLCNATIKYRSFCLCSTITEYSYQCAIVGGSPPDWRSTAMCYKSCPSNMIFKECSPPCKSTCSNPGQDYFCDGTCVAGCICPKGLVKDDITNLGCIPIEKCSCIYNNEIYPPGSHYNDTCKTCLCSGGHWNCKDVPCPSTCSVEGGSHITTFDKNQFTFHGKCVYILTEPCANSTFSVNIEMKKCVYSESGTCLTRVFLFLDDGSFGFEIAYDIISDFPHVNFNKEKLAKAGISIYWPSSFYLNVHTNKGLYLQVQLTPVMQLYIVLDPSYKGKMCGLCGNFNNIQKDDFRTSSGAVESNAVEFANTWKTSFKCKHISPVHEHPCIYGMEVEKYANYWCNILLDTEGPFSACHNSVSPDAYQQNCLFDTCACKRTEDCLCAALSSYVWACASAGIILSGWRENVCRNFLYHCPPSFVYSYNVTTCIPTCLSLSEPDPICRIKFHTIDGCICPNGTYLDDKGVCVKKEDCPCYYKGVPVSPSKTLNVDRLICTCANGKIQCTDQVLLECSHPMVYFDCDQAGERAKGTECSRTCDTSTVQCYSPLCVSGCLCPKGLVLNENRTCIREEKCPCVHNGIRYNPGDVVTIHCNQCVCRNRTWVCANKAEKGICTLYGEGHYITFDNKHYTINGDCEYTLVQDYCDIDHLWNGTFKVISENVPCGTTGTSCSKAITVYLGNHKLILANGDLEVLERSSDVEVSYKAHRMGLFVIIETNVGLVLVWDRKTSIYIHLSIHFKGKVCGLCGNFDGNGNNDFTTRSQCVVEDVKQFKDSWKVSPYCPEVYISKDPCVVNPYRIAWAQKMCNIILSHVFASCHSEVDPEKYYEACVKDTCACDMGDDCDCYCTAVSAYAQACNEACVCVEWRSPTVCPIFCDFYHKEGQCQWHYKACDAHCMKTCRNPTGVCLSKLKGLEGCYPKCPEDKPYFNEDEMTCVSQCGCLDTEGNYYMLGENVESCNVCEICICTPNGILCHNDLTACHCDYDGTLMEIGEVIKIDDGPDGCKKVLCRLNGTTEIPCYTTTEKSTGQLQTTTVLTTITKKLLPTTKKSQESSMLRITTLPSMPSQQTEASIRTEKTTTSTSISSTVTERTAKTSPASSTRTSTTQNFTVPYLMTSGMSKEITTIIEKKSPPSTAPSSTSLKGTTEPFMTARFRTITNPLTGNTNVISRLTKVSSITKSPETYTTVGKTSMSTESLQSTKIPTKQTPSLGTSRTSKSSTTGSSKAVTSLFTPTLSSSRFSIITTTSLKTTNFATITNPLTENLTATLRITNVSSTAKRPETSTTVEKSIMSTESLQSTEGSTKQTTSFGTTETTKPSTTVSSRPVTPSFTPTLPSSRLSTRNKTSLRTTSFTTTANLPTENLTVTSRITNVSGTKESPETAITVGETRFLTEFLQSTKSLTKQTTSPEGTKSSTTVSSSIVTSPFTTILSSSRSKARTTTFIQTNNFTTTTNPLTENSNLTSTLTEVSNPETSTTVGKTRLPTESLHTTKVSTKQSSSLGTSKSLTTVTSSAVTTSFTPTLPSLRSSTTTPFSRTAIVTTTNPLTVNSTATSRLTKVLSTLSPSSALTSRLTEASSTIKSPKISTTVGKTRLSTAPLQSTKVSTTSSLGTTGTTKSSTISSSAVTSSFTSTLSFSRLSTKTTPFLRTIGFTTTANPLTVNSTVTSRLTEVSSTIKPRETSTIVGKKSTSTEFLQSTKASTKQTSSTRTSGATKSSTVSSSAVTSFSTPTLSSSSLTKRTTPFLMTTSFSTTTYPLVESSTLSSRLTELSSTIKSQKTFSTVVKTGLSTESLQFTKVSTKPTSSLGKTRTTKSSTTVSGSAVISSFSTPTLSSSRSSTRTAPFLRTTSFRTTTNPLIMNSTKASGLTEVSNTIKPPEISTTVGKTSMSKEFLLSTKSSTKKTTSTGKTRTTISSTKVSSSAVTSSFTSTLSSLRSSRTTPFPRTTLFSTTTNPLTEISTVTSKLTKVSTTIKPTETPTTVGKTSMSTEFAQSTISSTKQTTSSGTSGTAKSSTVSSSAVTSSFTSTLSTLRSSTRTTPLLRTTSISTTPYPLTESSTVTSRLSKMASTIKSPETRLTASVQSPKVTTKQTSSLGTTGKSKSSTTVSSVVTSSFTPALSFSRASTTSAPFLRTDSFTSTTHPLTVNSTVTSRLTELSSTIKPLETSTTVGTTSMSTEFLQSTKESPKQTISTGTSGTTKSSTTVSISAVTLFSIPTFSSSRLTRKTTPFLRATSFSTTTYPLTESSTVTSRLTEVSSAIKSPESTTFGKTRLPTASLQSTKVSTKHIPSLGNTGTSKSSTAVNRSTVTSSFTPTFSSSKSSTRTTPYLRTISFTTTTHPLIENSTITSRLTELSHTQKSQETSITVGKTRLSTESLQFTNVSPKQTPSLGTTKLSTTVSSSAVTSSSTKLLSSSTSSTRTTPFSSTTTFSTTTNPLIMNSTVTSRFTEASNTKKSPELSTTVGKTRLSTESLQSTKVSTKQTASSGTIGTTKSSTVSSSAVTSFSTPTLSSSRLTRTIPFVRTTSVSTTTYPLTDNSTVTSRLTNVSSTIKSPETVITFGKTRMSTESLQSTKVSTKQTSSPGTTAKIISSTSFSTSGITAPAQSSRIPTQTKSTEVETTSVSKSSSKTSPHASLLSSSSIAFTIVPDEIITRHDVPVENKTQARTSTLKTFMPSSTSLPSVSILNPTTGTLKLVTPAYQTKCSNITCYENRTIAVAEVQCPKVETITCGDGSLPLKVYDQDGCCFQYECAHCLGPQGVIKNPGETWIDNCQHCRCEKYLKTNLVKVKISCYRVKCPPLTFSDCDKEWLKPYLTFTEEDLCCPKIECQCDPFHCKYKTETCSLGYEAVPTIKEGECCVTISCRPMNVCIEDGAMYQIGQQISVNTTTCKACTCSEDKDPTTGFNTFVCEPVLCTTHCPEGYDHESSNSDCCGTCVQKSCIVKAPDGSNYVLKPGESQFLSDDNCTRYTCELNENTFITLSHTQVCPTIDAEECTSGLFEKTPDGCCSICKAPKTCRVQTNVTEITQNGCSANVSLSYCEGLCPSYRKISETSFQMEGECVCCLEKETIETEVELVCPGNTDNIIITISSAKNCACSAAICTP